MDCQNPNHWIAIRRVQKYLRDTTIVCVIVDFQLSLKDLMMQTGYLILDEMKSTSGYVFTLGGGVVFWKSFKQTFITRSNMEAEYISLEKNQVLKLSDFEIYWQISLYERTVCVYAL